MKFLIASESRAKQATEAFGYDWDSDRIGRDFTAAIRPNQFLIVLFEPLSGLLNQNKMLPIRYAPITIELELVDSITDPIIDLQFGTRVQGQRLADVDDREVEGVL